MSTSKSDLRKKLYSQYDQRYFDGGPNSPGYDNYTDSWIWGPLSEVFLKSTKSERVLEWGCAKGFFVKMLFDRGIQVEGVDVSEYAIKKSAVPSLTHLILGPKTSFSEGTFDAIVSFETMEHIHESELDATLREFRRISTKWFYGSIFLETQSGDDPTHVTVKSREFWDELFYRHGYEPRLDVILLTKRFPVWKALGWEPFCYKVRA